MRFLCPDCDAVFETGSVAPPMRVACAACRAGMEVEAEVHRLQTRPYDLDVLRAQLEEERRAAHAPGQVWFVGVDGHILGPLTPAGLEGLHARGQLARHSLVWRDGFPVWAPAESVPELRRILDLPELEAQPPALPGSARSPR